MTSPRGPEVPYIFLLQSPLPFLHSFIQSSFYCSLNQTNCFKQRWPCVCNYAYYLHLLYACIMQKKSLPKLRSSPHLWIRPPLPILLSSMQSFFHPPISHSSFLQTNRLEMAVFYLLMSTLCISYGRASCKKSSSRGPEDPFIFGLDSQSLF